MMAKRLFTYNIQSEVVFFFVSLARHTFQYDRTSDIHLAGGYTVMGCSVYILRQ